MTHDAFDDDVRTCTPLLIHRTECAFHMRGLGDHVRGTVGRHLPDGQYAWHARRAVSAYDSLQRADHVSCDNEGISLYRVGRGCMSSGAVDGDVERIG